jgi:ribonuclease P protein component
MGAHSFPKAERLVRKKTIEELFQKGGSFSVFPLKILYQYQGEPGTSHQVLVTVPARTFRKATDRNTLKRRIREGYRLNKGLLTTSTRFSVAYIYTAREILPSSTIHQAIQSSLQRLNRYEKKD